MSLLAWPARRAWRFPGRAEPVTRCRPPAPFHAARPLGAQDFEAVYGSIGERRACVAGHDLVTWHGPDACWVCGGPGLRRNVEAGAA